MDLSINLGVKINIFASTALVYGLPIRFHPLIFVSPAPQVILEFTKSGVAPRMVEEVKVAV